MHVSIVRSSPYVLPNRWLNLRMINLAIKARNFTFFTARILYEYLIHHECASATTKKGKENGDTFRRYPSRWLATYVVDGTIICTWTGCRIDGSHVRGWIRRWFRIIWMVMMVMVVRMLCLLYQRSRIIGSKLPSHSHGSY